jgi:hypothetical protein
MLCEVNHLRLHSRLHAHRVADLFDVLTTVKIIAVQTFACHSIAACAVLAGARRSTAFHCMRCVENEFAICTAHVAPPP